MPHSTVLFLNFPGAWLWNWRLPVFPLSPGGPWNPEIPLFPLGPGGPWNPRGPGTSD